MKLSRKQRKLLRQQDHKKPPANGATPTTAAVLGRINHWKHDYKTVPKSRAF